VINTNLQPISYHFQVIEDYCSNLVRKAVIVRYCASLWGLRGTVRCSS